MICFLLLKSRITLPASLTSPLSNRICAQTLILPTLAYMNPALTVQHALNLVMTRYFLRRREKKYLRRCSIFFLLASRSKLLAALPRVLRSLLMLSKRYSLFLLSWRLLMVTSWKLTFSSMLSKAVTCLAICDGVIIKNNTILQFSIDGA